LSIRITERSLYKPIGNILKKFGVKSVQEVSIEGEGFPDIQAEIDGHKFLIEVRIDTESKLLEVVPRAFQKVMKINAQGAISILFPSDVRQIHPSLLDEVAPRLRITKAIVSTPWVTDSWKEICLEDFAQRIAESYRTYIETLLPTVSYDVVVDAAREAVVEIASTIRHNLVTHYLNDAMAIVGRFDIYRATLTEFEAEEEEMKAYIADIATYLIVNQLLFYHILSQKTGKYPSLPDVNPFMPDKNLINRLKERFSLAAQDYQPVFGPDLLSIIGKAGGLNSVQALSKYISTLKALKPEHVKAELLGRLYQESIPPETRKNLGAFFTKPKAAAILATLTIDHWNEKVLDPACGSGTLLTEAYKRKKKLAPPTMNEEELHKKLLSDIHGIDIMAFAHHMTSINLLAQNLIIPAKLEHVKAGDGLSPMVRSIRCEIDDPSPLVRLEEWIESIRPPEGLPHEGFDVVIMNPPFTRRERLSEIGELNRLENLFSHAFEGEVIRGKVGYWAYFVAAADNMIKLGGKLAMVTPEEFFAGGDAESLRRFIFLNEVFRKGKGFVSEGGSRREYTIKYIIRSGKEMAFSEGASYRDYLMVLEKKKEKEENGKEPIIFVILKKPIDEIAEEEVVNEIKNFEFSLMDELSTDNVEAVKIYEVKPFLERYIGNLKPLASFNTIKTKKIFLELLKKLSKYPTLKTLSDKGLLRIQAYNPGQFITKGVEAEARNLFVKRYKGRGKALFEYVKKDGEDIILEAIGIKDLVKLNSLEDTVPALRTYANVRKINISDEEEIAIINPKKIPAEIRKKKGILNLSPYIKAANDIKAAYKKLAGEVLLVRKVNLASPNLFWLAFYTKNDTLGTTSALLNTKILDHSIVKEIIIYLNSSICLLQLLGFIAEVGGAYTTLHGDQVWKYIRVPYFDNLAEYERKRVVNVFDKVCNIEVEALFTRFRNKSFIQKLIDEVSLEMLGLDNWKNRLNELYDAITDELQVMLEVLKRSKKPTKKKVKQIKEEKYKQISLDELSK